jgi:hypothetical protein
VQLKEAISLQELTAGERLSDLPLPCYRGGAQLAVREKTPSEPKALPCRNLADIDLRGRANVLVHSEKVSGIVLLLDFSQAVIVFSIACSNALLALFHHKIYVRSAR